MSRYTVRDENGIVHQSVARAFAYHATPTNRYALLRERDLMCVRKSLRSSGFSNHHGLNLTLAAPIKEESEAVKRARSRSKPRVPIIVNGQKFDFIDAWMDTLQPDVLMRFPSHRIIKIRGEVRDGKTVHYENYVFEPWLEESSRRRRSVHLSRGFRYPSRGTIDNAKQSTIVAMVVALLAAVLAVWLFLRA